MTGTPRTDGLLLALESSGAVGSVAVGRPGFAPRCRILLEERRQHAARLVPAVGEALEEAGVSMGELAGVVVGQGPGSFTGVRVAAATAKGLAHALRIPLWPVSSLAAGAVGPGWDGEGADAGEEVAPEGGGAVRYVLFDARGDRIYAACYRVGPSSVEALVPPRAGTLGRILTPPPPAGAVFAGTGARRHRERITASGFPVAPAPCGDPGAAGLLRWLGLDRGAAPADDPGLWEPTYLRSGSARPTPGR